ncbi:hypothetical protein WMC41_09775 [Shinella yambaruensis]|uniref:hypothetical protein n=1 Tax=Shinella yambaruensis TaxID=415996 RepID=UPI003D7B5D8F
MEIKDLHLSPIGFTPPTSAGGVMVMRVVGLGGALFPQFLFHSGNSLFEFLRVLGNKPPGTLHDKVVDVRGFSRQPQPGRLGSRFLVSFPVADVGVAIIMLDLVGASVIAAEDYRPPIEVAKLGFPEFNDLGDGHVVLIFFEHNSSMPPVRRSK